MDDKRACSLCRRDHKICDGERPCARCAQKQWECRNVMKRGRPRKDGSTSQMGAPKPKRWRMHMVEPPAALPIISPLSASSSCFVSQAFFSLSLVPIAPMPQPSMKGDTIQSQQQLLLSELMQEVQLLRQNTTHLKETHMVLTKQLESINTTVNDISSQNIPLPLGARLSYMPFVMRHPQHPHVLSKAEVVPGEFQPSVLLDRLIDMNGEYSKLLGYDREEFEKVAFHESVLPKADPNNVIELHEVLRNLRSQQPVSPIFSWKATLANKDGVLLELIGEKQFFYNDSGELSFTICCINCVQRRPRCAELLPEEEMLVYGTDKLFVTKYPQEVLDLYEQPVLPHCSHEGWEV